MSGITYKEPLKKVYVNEGGEFFYVPSMRV